MRERYKILWKRALAARERLRETARRPLRRVRAKRQDLYRWELALALAVCVTICQGLLASPVQVGWWGVIFPGLTPQPAQTETAEEQEGEVRVRLWLLDRLLDW